MLKQASIYEVERLDFECLKKEEFEKLIDPQNFNYQIHIIKYARNSWESISDLTFENISKINPQKLYQLILKTL